AQGRVAAAGFVQEGGPLPRGLDGDGLIEDAVGAHDRSPDGRTSTSPCVIRRQTCSANPGKIASRRAPQLGCKRPYSQARATLQWRWAVAREMPSACAVSSRVQPAKKRSWTT